MEIQKNVLLKNYTTFKIGGPAKYFCAVKNKKDLIEAVSFAKKTTKIPFFILGGGSNLLVSDKGFNGLVVKIENCKLSARGGSALGGKINIFCGAGVSLSKLVSESAKIGVTGLEWAAGIPGATVGGAVRGNAGAFETEIKDLVRKVEAFDAKNQKIKIFKNNDCQFSYRSSIFKKNQGLIIFSCELQLAKTNKNEVKERVKEILSHRREKHPIHPSAGSIFKNPENIRARELIEKCGLAGKTIGRAQISKQHANFIINLGGARAKDVLALINLAKKEVKNKFRIKIEEEIKLLGDF